MSALSRYVGGGGTYICFSNGSHRHFVDTRVPNSYLTQHRLWASSWHALPGERQGKRGKDRVKERQTERKERGGKKNERFNSKIESKRERVKERGSTRGKKGKRIRLLSLSLFSHLITSIISKGFYYRQWKLNR